MAGTHEVQSSTGSIRLDAGCPGLHPSCGPSLDAGCSQCANSCGTTGASHRVRTGGETGAQQIPTLSRRFTSGYRHSHTFHHCGLPRPGIPQFFPDIAGYHGVGPEPPYLDAVRYFFGLCLPFAQLILPKARCVNPGGWMGSSGPRSSAVMSYRMRPCGR